MYGCRVSVFYNAVIIFAILCVERALCTNIFGFVAEGSAYISTCSSVAHNGVTICDQFDWVRQCGDVLVGLQGNVADCEEVFDTLSSQTTAHSVQFPGTKLSPKSVAHLCRSLISRRLRTKNRLDVGVLVAGVDQSEPSDDVSVPVMYWVDDLGAIKSVRYAAHGPDTPFLLSILDQNRGKLSLGWSEASLQKGTDEQTLSAPLATAKALASTCWRQLQTRSRGRVSLGTAKLFGIDHRGVQSVDVS